MVQNKSKRNRPNKPTSLKYKHYKIEGVNVKRDKCCPRCGQGIFLMNAKDRLYCGKCHYTTFEGKKTV